MLTIEKLNQIKAETENLVLARREAGSHDPEVVEKSGYKYQVLVCGGTGCTSSGCKNVVKALRKSVEEYGIQEDVNIVTTGCFGLCALGPIMIVYPEGSFYSQVQAENIPRIVREHLVGGNVVKDLLYQHTIHEDGSVISLNETDF